MTRMHYSFKSLLCLQVKDLLVHLQFSPPPSPVIVIIHYLSLSIQHRVVGISGDLEGSSYHPDTQSCIPTLSTVPGQWKSAMGKVRLSLISLTLKG